MSRPAILIVTPAFADANNGNWQTAQRWARFLSEDYRVTLAKSWEAGDDQAQPDLLLALHARRSAASVRAWAEKRPGKPLLLVLTGTDLYQDIQSDAAAQASLRAASALVVLNELGLRALPEGLRAKAHVCLQSCAPRQALADKPRRWLRALMVGHLREVKSPQTYFDAAKLLAGRPDIRLDHIGAALEPALGAAALALMQRCPQYRWLGALPHQQTRKRIQAAHVLVHPSRLEGGAHAVIEALCSGTPVLASRVDGNVGLLGEDYLGLFDWNDAAGLADLLRQCRDDPAMLTALRKQADARAALFHPDQEKRRLRAIVAGLLSQTTSLQEGIAP
ncbi:selenoneine biosynthesis selenosugar synthase SenB [Roseateles oligotrophus]|uniref:TIGR04348 family glycosyltransferase n=1 Tax=Roseateles oligotrophus TaxID=1769250 RepID=A0ABT2YHF0_9BURK|nr:selenoneine biosynthesis selenosugar synthase SenB [Roseateles oligotrophus]MCV2369464.1 TIGR04348 family glycosyltransferase [Roseateles oligotrophus]